nr:immunoglobulin light chain junction region [Macaca mulatta]
DYYCWLHYSGTWVF